jgi:UDP-N-acetylglucosamine diphosphorylase / glucose-1-phosphate thymidylyltransferase / UDP-N-acetylgalactosamine diphosphorylase / glucosamine-1-phosphate N-acetyltransferase / galactosamine-1-phosphate N-acetyltransferase
MLYFYDDARARAFEPFASTRPIAEMTAGVASIRDRWSAVLGVTDDAQYLTGAAHAQFDEAFVPGAGRAAHGIIPAGSIVANSRCVLALTRRGVATGRRRAARGWRVGDRVAAIRLDEPVESGIFAEGGLALGDLLSGPADLEQLEGWWHDEVWDFIRLLPEQLTADITALAARKDEAASDLPSHVTVLGDGQVVLRGEMVIEPHVVLDTTTGPILIEAGAHVRTFTRICGPCRIGRGATVLSGEISGCSIGEVSKVRGELSTSVLIGHSNKSHDGFVGHSYLGRWVNLGAGTITSNLKNTYGIVALWTPDGTRDTGMQFLGTLFGDYVKTGIGLRLTTGTVIGAGANVYGGMPPKVVPPFSWGDASPYTIYRADKFVEAAARAMARRHVELTDRARRHLESMHAGRWTAEREARDS